MVATHPPVAPRKATVGSDMIEMAALVSLVACVFDRIQNIGLDSVMPYLGKPF